MMEKSVVSSLRTYAWAHSKRRGTNGDGFIDLEEKQVAKEKKQASVKQIRRLNNKHYVKSINRIEKGEKTLL